MVKQQVKILEHVHFVHFILPGLYLLVLTVFHAITTIHFKPSNSENITKFVECTSVQPTVKCMTCTVPVYVY